MKRAFWFPAAFAIAFCGAAFGTRAAAQGDSKQAKAADAAKAGAWEYKVFLLDAHDFRDKDDWKDFVTRADGNELRADADFKGYVLSHLASEGWELVQVVQLGKDKNEMVHFYLRRPKTR